MPLGRSAAHKICVSALEWAKTLISKEALNSFQRGVGFLIRWQSRILVFRNVQTSELQTVKVF